VIIAALNHEMLGSFDHRTLTVSPEAAAL
jgi:hypothetical protein